MRILLFLLFISFGLSINAQDIYTKYDDIPGNNKSYKPAYQDEYPDWAKMLYQDEVNYYEVSKLFKEWEAQNTNTHKPIRRYFKNWSKHIQSWVSNDGSITLPDLDLYHQNLLKNSNIKKIKQPNQSFSRLELLRPKRNILAQ